ncbi:MAG TPA: acetylglutamate kinase [Terriglobales bacterium]|nr:acetylglutamate kinase [Terriglobales bacterium]
MRVVVKIGGAALDDETTRRKCARAVGELAHDSHQVAVVHGGGRALTRTLKLLGQESEFVNGLRVTDRRTRDVAVMVLAGLVNKQLVAAIQAQGFPALGLSGGDGISFRARKQQTQGSDLGFVGEICSSDARWLELIWGNGGIPVLSSIALGSDGEYYNVNADQMAAACAAACHADALIFLTDVPGVKNREGAVIRYLTTAEVADLAADRVIAGGMLPKLEASKEALRRGVRRVRIFPAEQAEVLGQFYFCKLECGTEVTSA